MMSDAPNEQCRFDSAADRLEELKVHMDEIMQLLREGGLHSYGGNAYAQVYELRREIGYVVRELGVGIPERSGRDWYA